MTSSLVYLSHPEVAIDPDVPVPEWSLSPVGRERVEALADRSWVRELTRVISSDETKAIETAEVLAAAAQARPSVEVRPATAEIDRSSTGYLSHEEHEAQADRLFGAPEQSARGWERAVDAQARMIESLADLLVPSDHPTATAVVGHGGVGTLWWCHLAGVSIARHHDQRRGGCLYRIDLRTGRPDGPWVEFEQA